VKVLLNALQAGNRSGTGHYAAKLARWLPDVSGDMEIVTLWPRGVARSLDDGHSRRSILCDVRSPSQRVWLDQVGVPRIGRRLGADLIHYPANVGNVLRGKHTVVTVHDLSFFFEPKWFRPERGAYYRFATRRSVRHARRVLADSHSTANDLHEMLGVPEDRIAVTPLGVDMQFQPVPEEERQLVRERYGLPSVFLLYVGTLEPRKNLVRVVEAFDRIAGDWEGHLVVAGREGWKTGRLMRAIEQSAYRERIHLPGFVEGADLPAVYGAAHAFVWPSLYEGFGLPPLEAMACGTPVLTSDVSSIPEVVGEAALTVNPYDLEAIASAMYSIATDGPLRAGLRAKGRIQAGQYTWRRTAERTCEAYRAAVEG